jgi:hypothetical protein
MAIRKLALLASSCVFGLVGAGAGSASAATYVHGGTTSGNLLPAASTILNRSSDTATLTLNGTGELSCTVTTGFATVGASGGATVSATGNSLTFTSCTDTIPVINIQSCHLAATTLPTAVVTATSHNGGTVVFSNTFVRCVAAGSTSGCYYKATTASGTASNTGATLSYASVGVTHTAPAGATDDLGVACGTIGSFSMALTDLVRGATGTTLVLNQTP